MKEKDEIDEKDRKKIALTENNDADEIIIIKRKKREISGPRIKKQKMNKTEDKELQIACEDKEEKKERLKEERKEKEKLRKKEEELKNKNLIYRIDEQNYICGDCEKEKSIYISINNGITICNTCAQEHQLLGHSISYIISINEKLDEYIFNFIVFGSNTRFKRFIINENIDNNFQIKKKYKA